jgi:hypothetical protein
MADQLQLRGGSTAQTAAFTGALREVTVDTDKKTVVVHDGTTAGGNPLLRQDLSNLPAGTIDNADINASAGIVDTKLATIATAGKVSNSATTATSANTANAIVARDASGNFDATSINGGPLAGTRNRIINGDMLIDQRNFGASVTPTVSGTNVLDRWLCVLTQASKYSVQRNAGGVTPPAGFTNYLGVTSLSAYSLLSSDLFWVDQRIEGLNAADLAWGTANAKTVTLSFWVRSSLTGTFGGNLNNDKASIRSYPYAYTIISANTWEYKTIQIPGDTTGTWGSDNTTGILVAFGLGAGSTYSGTANAWAASNLVPTGATSVVGTNGATFYITGVQLEPGPVATPFEQRPIGTELALCQRYYYKTYNQHVVPGSASSAATYRARSYAGSYAAAVVQFPVLMRTAPTCTVYNSSTGATNSWRDIDSSADRSASLSTALDSAVTTESSSVTANTSNLFHIVATAEL